MLAPRSLADRLAAARGQRPVAPERHDPPPADRAAGLARWLGADLHLADVGRVVLVERTVPLDAETVAVLRTLPEARYVDTETTGLSTGAGTVAFLVAIGTLDGDRLRVRQWLLPDYPDEGALLRRVADELGSGARLVSYNGRAFDLPLLVARLTVHGLFPALAEIPERHDDLLPVARRLFRRPLGGARLADVERGVLGIERVADLPGFEVPGRWFGYLRGGSPDLLADVLDHNLQDVASLALLEAHIVGLRRGAWRSATVLDPRGMVAELLRNGAAADSLELLAVALERSAGHDEDVSLRRLATRLLVAAGKADRAEEIWHEATRRASVQAAAAWIEVARIRERHRGDLRGALEATAAASRVLDLAFALGRGGSIAEIGRARLLVEGRLRRLRRWVAARERREGSRAA
ncbi:MAG TPA: ribonuclease H-like domain-containing protein [Candidatus Limnocylindria bacterium]|nr:ribonuclease H-like domain-containing protein [Candidatus Limnocylindria bacterium]